MRDAKAVALIIMQIIRVTPNGVWGARASSRALAPLTYEVANVLKLSVARLRKIGLAVRETPERAGNDSWVVRSRVVGFTNIDRFRLWIECNVPEAAAAWDIAAVEAALA
jgi:hypothetical protein